ncbi:MAG: PQQ-binding-like beta-propeller repeat protein [Halobacteria archaeon]
MKARVVLVLAVLLTAASLAEAQTTRWWVKTNATSISVDVSEGGEFVVEGRPFGLYFYDRQGNLLWGKNLGSISRVALSPGAERIVVAAEGKIHAYDRAGNLLGGRYGESGVEFVSVDVSRDRIVAGSSGGRLVMLDFVGNVVWSKPLCSGVRGLSFSPDGTQIAAAAGTCVYLLDLQGNEILVRNPNDEALTAAGGRDRIAYGVKGGDLQSAARSAASWKVYTGDLPAALSMAPAGWFLLASGWDLYQISDGGSVLKQWISPSPEQSGPVTAAALSPDGAVLAFAVSSNLTVWESLPAPAQGLPTPSPSPTGRVVYVCPDGTTANDPELCPKVPSPTPAPAASPGSPAPTASENSPPPPVRPAGPPLSIPVGPIVGAAGAIAATFLALRWIRKNRETIDRWRLERRMRRI